MSGTGLQPAAFSVDLEDWFHAELVRRRLPAEKRVPRVEVATAPILDLLERRGVRATFFVVGELIRDAPHLIRRIAGAGHEIGCHTFSHRTLWDMTPAEFRTELLAFREALADVAPGAEVRGFRAPTFSVDERTSWALRILEEEGYAYDSSIVPARGPLYGCPEAPLQIYRCSPSDFLRQDPNGPLVEFPAPVVRLGGIRLPVAGGFYLRVLPFPMFRRLVTRVLRRQPFFLYVHPWETDAGTPRVPLPCASRWATYAGIPRMLGKVERLLDMFPFRTMRETMEAAGFRIR